MGNNSRVTLEELTKRKKELLEADVSNMDLVERQYHTDAIWRVSMRISFLRRDEEKKKKQKEMFEKFYQK